MFELFSVPGQTQILEKDVATCDDGLYSIREHIFRIKEDIKSDEAYIKKSETISALEPSIHTRDIQNNIKVFFSFLLKPEFFQI